MEQQEMHCQQKEQAEGDRLRQENERRRETGEEDAMDKVRKSVDNPTSPPEPEQVSTKEPTEPDNTSPNHTSNQEKAAAERERQRLREQERRRREAMAGQIDMNMQSDLMAAFENSF